MVMPHGKFDSTSQEHYPDQHGISMLLPLANVHVFSERLHYSKMHVCKTRVDCNKIINLEFLSKIFTKHSTVCILFMVGWGS